MTAKERLDKIERALRDLNDLGELYLSTHTRPIKYTKGYDFLKEVLVDFKNRETPEKLIKDKSEYEKHGECDYICPSCNKYLGGETYDDCLYFKYCPECGRRLAVSKMNEIKQEIINVFKIPKETLENFDVIIWDYTNEYYQGSAFLLLRDKNTNKLYEVYGSHSSHCSCHGLEGQFELEEVTKKELMFRLENNESYGTGDIIWTPHYFRDDLIKFLNDYSEVDV